MSRRVVVTGMGAVTPIGNNVKDFWENVKKGTVGIGPITKFVCGCGCKRGTRRQWTGYGKGRSIYGRMQCWLWNRKSSVCAEKL